MDLKLGKMNITKIGHFGHHVSIDLTIDSQTVFSENIIRGLDLGNSRIQALEKQSTTRYSSRDEQQQTVLFYSLQNTYF